MLYLQAKTYYCTIQAKNCYVWTNISQLYFSSWINSVITGEMQVTGVVMNWHPSIQMPCRLSSQSSSKLSAFTSELIYLGLLFIYFSKHIHEQKNYYQQNAGLFTNYSLILKFPHSADLSIHCRVLHLDYDSFKYQIYLEYDHGNGVNEKVGLVLVI